MLIDWDIAQRYIKLGLKSDEGNVILKCFVKSLTGYLNKLGAILLVCDVHISCLW